MVQVARVFSLQHIVKHSWTAGTAPLVLHLHRVGTPFTISVRYSLRHLYWNSGQSLGSLCRPAAWKNGLFNTLPVLPT